MKTFSLLLVETPSDAATCGRLGVFDFSIGGVECENCSMVIGAVDDLWIPAVVVVDNHAMVWPVCVDCSFPTLLPGAWFDR